MVAGCEKWLLDVINSFPQPERLDASGELWPEKRMLVRALLRGDLPVGEVKSQEFLALLPHLTKEQAYTLASGDRRETLRKKVAAYIGVDTIDYTTQKPRKRNALVAAGGLDDMERAINDLGVDACLLQLPVMNIDTQVLAYQILINSRYHVDEKVTSTIRRQFADVWHKVNLSKRRALLDAYIAYGPNWDDIFSPITQETLPGILACKTGDDISRFWQFLANVGCTVEASRVVIKIATTKESFNAILACAVWRPTELQKVADCKKGRVVARTLPPTALYMFDLIDPSALPALKQLFFSYYWYETGPWSYDKTLTQQVIREHFHSDPDIVLLLLDEPELLQYLFQTIPELADALLQDADDLDCFGDSPVYGVFSVLAPWDAPLLYKTAAETCQWLGVYLRGRVRDEKLCDTKDADNHWFYYCYGELRDHPGAFRLFCKMIDKYSGTLQSAINTAIVAVSPNEKRCK